MGMPRRIPYEVWHAVSVCPGPSGGRFSPATILAGAAQARLGWPADPWRIGIGMYVVAGAGGSGCAGPMASHAGHHGDSYGRRLVEGASGRSAVATGDLALS